MDYETSSVRDREAMISEGLWSQNEFNLDPKDEDMVLNAVTFENKDARFATLWFHEHTHDGVRSLFLSLSDTQPAGTGAMAGLPQELIDSVLCRLDMMSLFRVRHVNRHLRDSVNLLSRYRDMVRYGGFDITLALLRSGMGLHIGLQDMYSVLCTRDCTICGAYLGTFVFLLGCIRCCEQCLKSASETRVCTLNHARGVYGGLLSKEQLASMPKMAALPGLYGHQEKPITGRKSERPVLVSVSTLGTSLYGELERWDIPGHCIQRAGLQEQIFGVADVESKAYTCMAACVLPWLDRDSGVAETQLRCVGCAWTSDQTRGMLETIDVGSRDLERRFSRRSFLDRHFRRCKQAQNLWLSTDRGSREPTFLVALDASQPANMSSLLVAEALPDVAKGGIYGSYTHQNTMKTQDCTCDGVDHSTPEQLVSCWMRWQQGLARKTPR